MAALILWGHALAALAFGGLVLAWLRLPLPGLPRIALVVALSATALWALAIAGIGVGDVASRIAETVRNIAWLGVMIALVLRTRSGSVALYAVYAAAATITVFATMLALVEVLPLGDEALSAVLHARLVTRMLAAVGALFLLHHLVLASDPRDRGHMLPFAGALGAMWGIDLTTAALHWAMDARPDAVIAVRGFVLTGAALLLVLAGRRGERAMAVSHGITLRLLSVAAIVCYAGFTILLTQIAEHYAGDAARIVQTAIVLGATTALLTLLSTPWLRAWAKVKVAKHFFRHRYDYRAEWQRFTATLGTPGGGADPLDHRIVRAIADLTGSPAGLLLVPDGQGLGAGAAWHWAEPGPVGAALPGHLATTARIVELDAVRRGDAPPEEAAAIPDWMRDCADAWALVPLIHGTSLIGVILLARPALDRPLDWEDLDLLRVAGRQAASYLAEDRAHAALADAARFDEFNRRFAFIIHDIKNLVSGLSLVARNAERHADNPEFRTDMVATLKDSAARMNALLARLSQHHRATPEPLQPVDVAALALRLAAGRRAQHPVTVEGAGIALAQPGRLEQLLGHLVQNAVEASAPGAPILIVASHSDGRVVIDVIDRGCGMSAAYIRDQLYRPFTSSKPDGFGIGAYEARQLADGMGGTLDVASREGEGTRFRLSLPVAVAVPAALEAAA